MSILGVFAWLTVTTEPCQQQVCWQVAPTVCVVEQPAEYCEFTLSLHWQSQQTRTLCLYLEQRQLQCFDKARAGQFKQSVTLSGHANLEMREGETIILQQPLTVLSRYPERRRRLVVPWSIF